MAYDFVIEDKDGFGLGVDEDGTARMFFPGDYYFDITPDLVESVVMKEPGFFKKGFIAFVDEDEEIIKISTDNGGQLPLVIDVSRKYKDDFYLIFSALNNNGFDVIPLK